ncbi:acyl-CoA dehydrogenase family protein [Candidatus Binatus sp.]|uniref:acyl-CoA dehydrogenase family protein n=1 Tax=Candidatus Binatus sp. TaxID=2811406 RepID=UPI003BAF87A7
MDRLISERARPYFEKVQKIGPIIRAHADRAEREAQMPREVIAAFHDAGLFRILIPRNMGGGELTIPDSLRLCEEVSRIDGSAGWNFAICSGSPLFGYNLSRAAFEKIYGDPLGVSAGSLNPATTRVVASDGGWRFSGKATYASASAHATYLMAAGMVLRDGAPQLVDGFPVMRAGLFPIKNAKILNTWSTAGMRGTGSNDCEFDNVFVPDEFTFDWLNAKSPWQRGAFEKIPLQLQFVGGLVSVVLGTARHALDTLNEIAQAKVPAATRATLRERSLAQIQYAQAEGLLRAARAYFYNCNDEIWREGEAGETFSIQDRAHARLAVVTAAKLAVQAVDLVADAAGMNSAQTSCPIERCWRDVHTATQHVLMNTARFEVVGRVLFGLDPGSPVI